MSNDRPTTSKSRGTCLFYHETRRCFAGDKCKFLHDKSDGLTPFDRAKLCRYYTNGYCRRGERCWFRHVTPASSERQEHARDDSEENVCCICLEKPTTYGLLAGCSHVYCIQCIRQWRDPAGKSSDVVHSGVTKKCPLCRSASRFITPSSHFYPQDTPEKEAAIEQYKESMARVPCRYFQNSKTPKLFCPFGRDCFYRHVNEDGSSYVFDHGADHNMKIYCSRRNQATGASSSSYMARTLEELSMNLEMLRSWSNIEPEIVRRSHVDGDFVDFSGFEGQDVADVELVELGGSERDREMNDLENRLMLATLASFGVEDDDERMDDDDDDDDDGLPMVSQLWENTTSDAEVDMGEIVDSDGEDESSAADGWSITLRPPNAVSTLSTPLPITLPVADNSSSGWGEGVTMSSDGWPDSWSLNADWGTVVEDSDNRATTPQSKDGKHASQSPSWDDTGVEGQSDSSSVQVIGVNGRTFDWRREEEDVQSESRPVRAFDLANVGSASADTSWLDGDERHGRSMGDEGSVGDEEVEVEGVGEVDNVSLRVPGGEGETVVEMSAVSVEEQGEPPFITDGRGRVVWGGARHMAGRGTCGRSVGSVKGKMPEKAADGAHISDAGGGFMTDGRGRVIGTSEENRLEREEGGEAKVELEAGAEADGERSSLSEKVYDAVLPQVFTGDDMDCFV